MTDFPKAIVAWRSGSEFEPDGWCLDDGRDSFSPVVKYVRSDIADEMLAALKAAAKTIYDIQCFTNLTDRDNEAHAACQRAIAKAEGAD